MQKINTQEAFGFTTDFEVFGNAKKDMFCPDIDPDYIFDPQTTSAILAGFAYNQRVLVQGLHGSGKSTHIEQVAARLNWGCIRVNFDSQITRLDLVGKDIVTVKDEKQITTFKEGVIPFALQNNIALIFDEYDAMRSDVAFVIHRLLEEEGKFSLIEENKMILPTENFRIFATSNTLGQGDDLGIYHGTNLINQAQMDRFNIVTNLDYVDEAKEIAILQQKLPFLQKELHKDTAKMMVKMANLTRQSFKNGDISNIISLRTLISWGRNIEIFGNVKKAFILSFYNKLIADERLVINEFYQRIFADRIEQSILQ